MGNYLSVFYDGVLSSFLIPLRSQTAFFAMKSFGEPEESLQIAAAVAVAGAVVGHSINLLLGLCVIRFCRMRGIGFFDKSYEKISTYFTHYGVVLLLFSFMPLFSVISFAAGFFGVALRTALLLLILGQTGYFLHQLFG